jgi:hypothetical protein
MSAEVAELADDRKSVYPARQQPIDDDEVPALVEREVQCVETIIASRERMAGFPQAIADVARGIGLIFDDEGLHASGSSRASLSSSQRGPRAAHYRPELSSTGSRTRERTKPALGK